MSSISISLSQYLPAKTLSTQILHRHPSQPLGPSTPIHPELQSEYAIATSLKNPTQPERPRHKLFTQEEITHLHGIARQPIDYHTQPKASTGAVPDVLEDLRDGEDGFDCQADVA
jgi:hypothetical protein